MKTINQALISEKSKKGLISAEIFSQSGTKEGRASPENYNDLLSLMQDSTFAGIVLQQTASLSSGKLLFNGDEKKVKKAKELMKEIKEPKIRIKTFTNLVVYSNAFWEIVYKGKKAVDLGLLETREMEIVDTPTGKILGYVQENDKGSVAFTPEQVVHLKTLEITTDNWGYAYNKHLVRIINAKMQLQNFLHWLVETNQFRNVFSVKEAGEKINDFLAYLRQAEKNPTKHLVVEGELTNSIMRNFQDGGNFLSLLNYYNAEIYRLMQTPPIVAGTVDNSNRSNSEAQLKSTYWSWLNYLRNDVYLYYVNYELLPKFGLSDLEAYFTPLDGAVSKEEIEVAKGLQELGMNDEGIKEHLKKSGVEFIDGVDLEKPDPMAAGLGKDGSGNKLFGKPPSRQPQDNFDKSKTGSESSTRKEQVGQKSFEKKDFTKYPYVIE